MCMVWTDPTRPRSGLLYHNILISNHTPSKEAVTSNHSNKMLTLSVASSTSAITATPKTTFTSSTITHKSSFNGIRIAHVLPSPAVRATTTPRQSVVMMAKREEELKEIRAKTTEEINDEIVDLKGELFMLRLQRSARNEFKSSEFRRMRKRVWNSSACLLNVRVLFKYPRNFWPFVWTNLGFCSTIGATFHGLKSKFEIITLWFSCTN